MSKDRRIRLKEPGRIWQMRVAGLAFRNGHVLVHRAAHERFWTFPGGRAEIGETTAETLRREMKEELGVEARIDRLLWSVENFFHYEGKDWQEYGLYYLMHLPESIAFHESEIIHRIQDGKNLLEFRWSKASRSALAALPIPPSFIAEEIENLPLHTRHLVWDDGDLDLL
ncbi:NUDIX hydrolase [Rhizobium paknamense]|uniref:8-oxo-dGTP pyrophosphatase MutT (NUDIX family) n=1 Tax=Rhizobium paknamense TaxID=1206817 RepID=A0ABU0IFM3_9HYPH|nr:NUDIX hydrolase [Rhizobium paknamense]MDQ0457060.1 8-oxo-dGTP pyrophosphatase MutT (NUDIX family) [Rhizobium paknamense]